MAQLSKVLLVKPGSKMKLADVDTSGTHGIEKEAAAAQLEKNLDRLSVLQYLLYAESRRSLLVVLQGIDAGGKDGTIQHVMSGLNPQGVRVTSFKVPEGGVRVTSFKVPEGAEKRHDYLWRVH